jgi:exportin-2 (importin alpha re-exporter)
MINLVLDRFAAPFLQVFRVFAGALFEGQNIGELELQGQISWRLLQLYYDLTAQDLPPIFEDSLSEFFAPTVGWFPKYLNWSSSELAGEPDDTTPSLLSQIKTTVLEIAEVCASITLNANIKPSCSYSLFDMESCSQIQLSSAPSFKQYGQ